MRAFDVAPTARFDEAILADATLGRAYVIPEADTAMVLDELDFREKGGYTRRIVEVERISDATAVRALLYRFVKFACPHAALHCL